MEYLSVSFSKAAEIQLLHAVDRVLLVNRWLRKATGIQPKFPYMVDSFEKRSAFSFRRASESTSYLTISITDDATSKLKLEDNAQRRTDLRLPFRNWFKHPWLEQQRKPKRGSEIRSQSSSSE